MKIKLDKSDKDASFFADQEPDWEVKLEMYDPRKNHNKFWHIRVYGTYVVRHWGRHGSKGQTSVHYTWSRTAAKRAAQELAWAKEDKGYEPDNTTILDRMAREV